MKFLIKIILATIAVVLTAKILPGIHVEDTWTAMLVALLLAILNVTIKPILIIFTIPFTILTFGIFLLFINGFVILMADSLISGFNVENIGWAILFSLVLSLVNSILEQLISSSESHQ